MDMEDAYVEKLTTSENGQWDLVKSDDGDKPKLKAIVTPKESEAPKTELDKPLQSPEVQDTMRRVIGSVKGLRAKIAQLKADKMAGSIERDLEADKQKAKIRAVDDDKKD